MFVPSLHKKQNQSREKTKKPEKSRLTLNQNFTEHHLSVTQAHSEFRRVLCLKDFIPPIPVKDYTSYPIKVE